VPELKIDQTVEVKKGKINNFNDWKGGKKYFSYRFDYGQLTGHGVLRQCRSLRHVSFLWKLVPNLHVLYERGSACFNFAITIHSHKIL